MIDMEQLIADRDAGTEGPLYALDSNTSSGLSLRGGKHHYPIAKMCSYWDGPGPREAEAKANYRRFARLDDLEAAFVEAVAVLEGIVEAFGNSENGQIDRNLSMQDARTFLARHNIKAKG